MALVRFVVLDDDFIGDAFIGQYTIPFVCMQQGERLEFGHEDWAGICAILQLIDVKTDS